MLQWLIGAAWATTCLSTSTVEAVEAQLAAAETAYADLDAAAFGGAIDAATLELPCILEPLPPATAARYHRLDAIRLYAAGELDRAMSALRAARALEPAYTFPDSIFPPDHELRRAYEALPVDLSAERPPQPKQGVLVFDGVETPRRPVGRDTVVQLLESGEVVFTEALGPDEPLPPFAARPRTRNRFLLASAGMLVASGAFYGAAWSLHPAYFAYPAPTADELARLRSRSVTWSALSGTAATLAASGVVLAFTIPERR